MAHAQEEGWVLSGLCSRCRTGSHRVEGSTGPWGGGGGAASGRQDIVRFPCGPVSCSPGLRRPGLAVCLAMAEPELRGRGRQRALCP